MEAPPPATNGDAQPSSRKRGGWVTFPFIVATTVLLFISIGGWLNNILVFMIEEFNGKSINSTQVWNVVHGFVTMFPVVGAIIADSFLDIFTTIWISSLINLLGLILLTIIAITKSLRPPRCEKGSISCIPPTKTQLAVLYTAMTLSVIGSSGSRFTLGTMGANQFDLSKPKHQRIFWNWFTFTLFVASAIAITLLVYIEDNVGWGLGFSLCVTSNFIGFVIFVSGNRFYRHVKPQGSPFTAMARVVVAAIRKRSLPLTLRVEDYYQGVKKGGQEVKIAEEKIPTKTCKFLNRAALITEGDLREDESIAKKWMLCTVQEVEDLKTLIKLLPLWTTGFFLVTPYTIQSSFTTLQTLVMDRSIGPHFKIPAGSMLVFMMIATCITIALIDLYLFPLWKKHSGRTLTPLQRVGIGHVLTILSMVVSAVVESKRLKLVHSHSRSAGAGAAVYMSAFWLVPQLALAGFAEAFQFPGHNTFYYQEFPTALKSTSGAITVLLFGVGFYVSTALVGAVKQTTGWLPDNINEGKMDNVYWVLALAGALNFGYFLVCAWMYKSQAANEEVVDEYDSSSNVNLRIHEAPEN
ncbi:Nitrate-transporting ATPase [Bertholletia excelsa]